MKNLRVIDQNEVNQVFTLAVKELVLPIVKNSMPGHCLRISSLSEKVMKQVCEELNKENLDADIVIILSPRQSGEKPWQISATRLIELRNEEKKVLLAFIPPGLKAAAEDSFDVSTFAEIELDSLPSMIMQKLKSQISPELARKIDHVINSLQDKRLNYDDIIRYYLTILKNDDDDELAGAGIYHLGLIPDFSLYRIPSSIEVQIARNHDVSQTLMKSETSLPVRIHNLRLKVDSIQTDLYRFLRNKQISDIRGWGSELVKPENRHLCFDQWPFEGENVSTKLLIYVEELDLKPREESSPLGPDNPLYLDVMKASSIKISWTTDPKSAFIPEIKYYRIEIISTDGDLVAWESKNIPVKSSFKRINIKEFRESVEDGLYYFRVRAYSESGELKNFEEPEENSRVLRDPFNPGGKRINTSDDVWFWKDITDPPPVEAARNIIVNSYLDAELHVRFSALDRGENPLDSSISPRPDRTGWFVSKGKSTESTYQIVYDSQTKFSLPISNLLQIVETQTLSNPDNLGRWRINFSEGKDTLNSEPIERQFHNHNQIPNQMLSTRRKLFSEIQNGNENLLSSTIDLLAFEESILDYSSEYLSWLESINSNYELQAISTDSIGRRHTDAVFLDIDTVQLDIPNDTPVNDRAYLICPTHPLRLLWHLQRAKLARNWIEKAVATDNPNKSLPASHRDFLRRGLAPMNLPPFIRPSHESFPYGVTKFYIEHSQLTPFWSLYMPEDIKDRRALFSRVKRILGINRTNYNSGGVGGIGKDVLSQKLQRYLLQHPYIKTIKINIFNPGDASLFVEVILKIEKERIKLGLSLLNYELYLFTQGSMLDEIGEAIEDIINPERQVSAEADAFSSPSQNPLFPKLKFYRNQIDEFLENHEKYQAHISLLHDVFPIDIDVHPVLEGRSSYLHGLIQDPITVFSSETPIDYEWQRQLNPTNCPGLEQNDKTNFFISAILDQLSSLQASAAIGKKTNDVKPTINLRLRIKHKNLINLVHKTSDWVFIIDKNLGLEYFDSGQTMGGSLFLLDFIPDFAHYDTDRLFLTTQVTDEITSLIKPALVDRDLFRGDGIEVYVLNLLRSLSGRLALKLLSTPNDISGVLGLALGRLFLEQFNLLDDQILIPIDSHTNLFLQSVRDNPLDDEISFKRGDLLLIGCNPENKLIHFNVIEVKLRSDLRDINSYLSLRQDIESQIINTQLELRKQFDGDYQDPDRIDRQVKNRELIALMTFYLNRSQRYGLISSSIARIFNDYIQKLDEGFQMSLSGVGLIFDFSSHELKIDEEHAGLVFYRIGKDYLQTMLDIGLRQESLLKETLQPEASIYESNLVSEKRQEILNSSDLRKEKEYDVIQSMFRKTTGSLKSTVSLPQNKIVNNDPKEEIELSPVENKPQVTNLKEIEPEDDVMISESNDNIDESTSIQKLDEDKGDNEEEPIAFVPEMKYDVLIGDSNSSLQYGLLGKSGGKFLALDLNGTNTISLFGVQGGGKSYTVGSIVEMATQSMPGINHLPGPLASVIFHYHENQDYPPEFVSMINPNDKENELRSLIHEYGCQPLGLNDVLILTSADKLSERRAEFPGIQVESISFSSRELSFKDWRFLMGVVGNQMYMKQINLIMRQLRQDMTLETLREMILESDLSDQQKSIANLRLNFAAQFIDDNCTLSDKIKPGRLIIIDLRDEFIDKDEALGLFVVMLNIFANAGQDDKFNKLIVFDEAHKYMDNPDLTGHIVDVIRQMRHQGVSVLIASQDPPSLPNAIIELSSLVVLHKFNSPQWLKHIQKSITALSELTPQQLAGLAPGEAFVWATKATERIFTQKAVKIHFRPRLTKHGGGTKTAV